MIAHTPALTPPEFIRLLANDIRWGVLALLAHSDRQVNELVTALGQPMNLVSYHLKKMRDEALVTTRRSEADGRDVYYSVDLDALRQRFFEAGMALHPALGGSEPITTPPKTAPSLPKLRVLFVCTHNSARSQMAEALMRQISGGQIAAFSAGSHPTHVHPDAVRTLDRRGIDISGAVSHGLHEYAEHSFDAIITVCDRAREVCPVFSTNGEPALSLHWGFSDPAAIPDSAERAAAFERTAQQLESRIRHLLTTLHR